MLGLFDMSERAGRGDVAREGERRRVKKGEERLTTVLDEFEDRYRHGEAVWGS